MATETGPRFDVRLGGVNSAIAVAAFVLLQVLAFAGAYATGRVTWYAYFMVLSTAVTAYLLDGSSFVVATATLGSVLVVGLGLPLFMFFARQTPSLVLEKALDPTVHRVLYLGVYGPLLAALLSLGFGIPLAHLLSEGFAGQPLVESLVDLPLVVPHSVAGIIVLFGFGQGGAFPSVSVLGSMIGMVLAMTFVAAPYAVNATREAFEAIDTRLEYASRIHGANRWETFRRVTGPLAVRGIVTGGVLAWARAVSEFGAVAVVAYSVEFFYLPDASLSFDQFPPIEGGQVTAQHAPVFVYNTYLQGGLQESGAVAFLLLAVSAVIFLIVRYLTDDGVTGGMP
jgi:molybdate/tungstate transport system permease protein